MDSTVTPSPSNPMGIKGVGEAGTIGATPANCQRRPGRPFPARDPTSGSAAQAERIWRAIQQAKPLAL